MFTQLGILENSFSSSAPHFWYERGIEITTSHFKSCLVRQEKTSFNEVFKRRGMVVSAIKFFNGKLTYYSFLQFITLLAIHPR
jgi:hypothetical protein